MNIRTTSKEGEARNMRVDRNQGFLQWLSCNLVILLLLSGCTSVGIKADKANNFLESDAFERGLMAYARGELDRANEQLHESLKTIPYDQRAMELMQVIHKEQGINDEAQRKEFINAKEHLPAFDSLSPKQVHELVLARNPDIRRSIFQVVEARAQLREANVNISPEFTFLTRFYPLGFLVGLSQSLIEGIWQRTSLMSKAEHATLVALAEYGRTRNKILTQAMLAYIDILEANQQVDNFKDGINTAREKLSYLADLRRTQDALDEHVYDFDLKIQLLKKGLIEAEAKQKIAKAQLNGLIDKDVSHSISVVDIKVNLEVPEDVQQAIKIAREQHNDLHQASAKINGAWADKDIVTTSMPQINLRMSYGDSAKAGRGDFITGKSIGAIMHMPILMIPLREAKEDRVGAFIRQLELERDKVRNQIAIDVVSAYQHLVEAHAQLRTAETQYTLASERLRTASLNERWSFEDREDSIQNIEMEYINSRRNTITENFNIQKAALQVYAAMGMPIDEINYVSLDGDTGDHFATNSKGNNRGLWIWRPTFIGSDKETVFFLDFAEAHKINTLFLFASRKGLEHKAEDYQRFIALAHLRGITVHALNGEAHWSSPDGITKAKQFVQILVEYNQKAPEAARFDALHLDVEPYQEKSRKVKSQRKLLLSEYSHFLGEVSNWLVNTNLTIAIDIPVWFTEHGEVYDELLTKVSEVALMAYQKDAQKIVSNIKKSINRFKEKNKALWVGLSADDEHLCENADESVFNQFAGKVESALENQEVKVGVAIHDYDRYLHLLTKQPSTQPNSIDCKTEKT